MLPKDTQTARAQDPRESPCLKSSPELSCLRGDRQSPALYILSSKATPALPAALPPLRKDSLPNVSFVINAIQPTLRSHEFPIPSPGRNRHSFGRREHRRLESQQLRSVQESKEERLPRVSHANLQPLGMLSPLPTCAPLTPPRAPSPLTDLSALSTCRPLLPPLGPYPFSTCTLSPLQLQTPLTSETLRLVAPSPPLLTLSPNRPSPRGLLSSWLQDSGRSMGKERGQGGWGTLPSAASPASARRARACRSHPWQRRLQ